VYLLPANDDPHTTFWLLYIKAVPDNKSSEDGFMNVQFRWDLRFPYTMFTLKELVARCYSLSLFYINRTDIQYLYILLVENHSCFPHGRGPSRDSNTVLPCSKPTRYKLSHAPQCLVCMYRKTLLIMKQSTPFQLLVKFNPGWTVPFFTIDKHIFWMLTRHTFTVM
jgi:hypothetical protein